MITLLLTVFLVVLISAICSMTEAALYSVPWTYIENLRKQGSATGELLYQLRSRIDQPIAAVLTLNTVANTAGAAIAGAVAANVLGADNTALFAAGLTILILALGEILPKTLGVAHACGVASGMARPLRLMVLIFKPFIWFSSMLTRLVASPQSGPSATEDDIRAIDLPPFKRKQTHEALPDGPFSHMLRQTSSAPQQMAMSATLNAGQCHWPT